MDAAGPDARLSVFENLTDMVVVLDAEGTIVYGNSYAADLLGYERDEQVGHSIAEFLHPDDLVRALEVATLIFDDALVVPVTPAVYRVRRADGTWCPIEINGASLLDAEASEPRLVIIGRFSGDHNLQDRLMEVLTSGAPFDEVIDLIPQFGLWRHPNELYAVLYRDLDGTRRATGSPLAVELATELDSPDTPWAEAARSGQEVFVPVDELPEVARIAAQERGLRACWAVPVADPMATAERGDGRDADDARAAILLSFAREHGAAPTAHRYALEMMARSLTLVLQWRTHLAQLEAAANRDPLTGLTNRTRFFELLEAPPRPSPAGEPTGAVLYVDLDGFKVVNDRHGHATGDAVLAQLAGRFCEAVRDRDTVVRLGGDEFAVLCPEISLPEDAVRIAERVIDVASQPVVVGDVVVQVGASVGIALTPTGGVAPDDLVDRADQALYQAKADGRGRWRVAGDLPGSR